MRTSSIHRLLALVAFAGLTACNDATPTAIHDNDSAALFGHNARDGAPQGTTPSWFKGKTVTLSYIKDFFCKAPPASGATSACELGEEPTVAPRPGRIPVAYVMAPLFSPAPPMLHCPIAGNCINHPSTIDLSRVFGPGTENAALPPHSHIIDEVQGNWWEIEVIGVTDPAIWAQIEEGKDLATVRRLQEAGVGITEDIPSNLYLFFNVRP